MERDAQRVGRREQSRGEGWMEGRGGRRDHWVRRVGVVSLRGGLVGVACKGVGVGADSNGFGEKRG